MVSMLSRLLRTLHLLAFLPLLGATSLWSITVSQNFTVPNDGNSIGSFEIADFTYNALTWTQSGAVTTNIFGSFEMTNVLDTPQADGTYGLTSGLHSNFFFDSLDFQVTIHESGNASNELATISFTTVEINFDPANAIGSFGNNVLASPFVTNSPGTQTASEFWINSSNPTVLTGTASIDYSPGAEFLGLTDTVVNLGLLPFTRSHFGNYYDIVDTPNNRQEGDFRLEGGVGPFFNAVIPAAVTGLPIDLDYEYFLDTAIVEADTPLSAIIPEPSTYGLILGGLGLCGVVFWRRSRSEKA
jgi:FlaG/FlaF family flagellin (archaellin)